jgi:hypothetical protein
MAGLDQAAAHGPAHVAETDEPDFHSDPPEIFCRARVPDTGTAVTRPASNGRHALPQRQACAGQIS